jgi:hypothetical protein
MPKWNGGVIGVANNPTQLSAKGIWSLSEATKAIRAGLWPPSNAGADPYFENVTLLLPGDGTNGAQNNTFLDSSTNNFTITRNGNTTQGTFTPFSKADGRWSNYFDGTGDVIYATESGGAFTFGTGDYEYSAWVFTTDTTAAQQTIFGRDNTGNVAVPYIYIQSTSKLIGVYYSSLIASSTTAIEPNRWYYITVSRVSGTTRIFVNGAQEASVSDTTTCVAAGKIAIGGQWTASGNMFTGYISNARVVKGAGVTSVTVPTTPLTAISGTSLLTCQSNRFIDNSTNAFAITRNGDVAVSTFSPFPTLTAYAAGTNGGSGYFDGTGDTLTAPSGASISGTGDFTVETWIYPTSIPSTYSIIAAGDTSNSLAAFILNGTSGLSGAASGTISFGRTLVTPEGNTSNTINWNAWNHLLISRVSGTLKLFINGVQGYSAANTTNYVSSVIRIGSDGGGTTNYYTGYVCGTKYVQGSGVTSVTVPTTPPTATSGTSLLLNFTNGGIIDTSMSNDLETVGNAQISTTQSKFGGASMYFDGTGDYIIPSSTSKTLNTFGTGDFTVELWMYANSFTTVDGFMFLIDFRPTSTDGVYPLLYFYNAQIRYYVDSADRITGSTLNTGQWYHIAVARSGTSTKMFINGTQAGSTYTDSNNYLCGTSRPVLGTRGHTLGDGNYNGYIDDLRITKGYARYTANFTAPVGPFNGFGD